MVVGAVALIVGIALRVDGRKYLDVRVGSDAAASTVRLGTAGLEF